MPDTEANETGLLASITRRFKSLSDLVAAVPLVSSAILGTYVGVANSVTKPEHGYTFRDPSHQSADPKKFTQKVLQYEVRNPGPGVLTDLQLIVHVDDTCDATTKQFSTGLRVGAIRTKEPEYSNDDGLTKITVVPTQIKGTSQLGVNQSFGVKFVSKDPNWQPKEIEVVHNGVYHHENAELSGYTPFLSTNKVLLISVILLIGAGIAQILLTRKTRTKLEAWAEKEAEARAQVIAVQEAIKQANAITESEPPGQEKLNRLEADAGAIIKARLTGPK